MSGQVNRPPAFADGKKGFFSLLDFLFLEVSAEIARRDEQKGQLIPIGGTTGEPCLLSSCMQILTNPAVIHRLERLEAILSRFWIDPMGFCDWPSDIAAGLERRSTVFPPPVVSRVANGPLNNSGSALNWVRVSAGTVDAVVPTAPTDFSKKSLRNRLPVGTQILQSHDPGHLGHVETMRTQEETT